jgi:glycosyltransferase involved in cell wall biosynthesis
VRIALFGFGTWPHTQRWANAVADRGHEVVLVWDRREFGDEHLAAYRDSVVHHLHDPPSRDRLTRLPLAGRNARRLGEQLRPDLVHALWLSLHGWTAQSTGVRPLVLSALGTDVLELEGMSLGPTPVDRVHAAYMARRTRSAVAAADVVLADSTTLAERVRAQVPSTRTEIVRFGVETTDVARGARREWRQRLDIPQDAFVLLSSRLVRPNYNIDTIIRALPLIRRDVPDATLVLKDMPRFSNPEYVRSCLGLAEELGVRSAIRVVGELEREELLELHAAADLYVSVPGTDGTAVSVLEAMAAGMPVVATDAPGIDPVILRAEESALLVPVRDAEALAAASVRLAHDDTLRSRLSENALEIVRLHGDFDRELDKAVLLYEQLVAAQRGRGTPV